LFKTLPPQSKNPEKEKSSYTTFGSFFRLGRIVLHYRLFFSFAIAAMLSYSFVTSAFPWVLRQIIDGLGSEKGIPFVIYFQVSLGILLMFAIRGIAYYWQNFLMLSLGQKLNRDLREAMFKKLVFMPYSYFNRKKTGDLLGRFTTDIQCIEQAFIVGVTGPFRDLTQVIFLLGYLAVLNFKLFLLCGTLLLPTAYMISFFGRKNKKISDIRQNKQGLLIALVNEIITGVRIVKAFNMELHEIRKFKRENIGVLKQFIRTIRVTSLSTPLLEFVAALYIVAVLAYGSYLIEQKEFTTGSFFAFVTAFYMISDPIRGFNGFSLKMAEAAASARRIFEVLDSVNSQEEKIKKPSLKPLYENLHIQVRSFGYREKEILRDVDFKIRRGERVAIVGESGSGKSTLVNLLPRFYDLKPDQGSIFFDQQNIRDFSLHSLRNQISIVSQETILFNDSIRYNISYGKKYPPFEQIEKASHMAYAHDFIQNFEKGYDQLIGEKGMSISGGQRQRIAIARAILKNAPILILDEATSSLDTQSEKEVNLALENLMMGRTTIIVSHKLLSIQKVDQIFVMEHGTLVEQGTFEQLMRKKGQFRKLYDLNFQLS